AYPVIESEVLRFCEGKRAVLMVEEGQPNFIEQNLALILRQAGSDTVLHGKDLLPAAGEYTAAEVLSGVRRFCERYGRLQARTAAQAEGGAVPALRETLVRRPLSETVHPRPPGFCTGCPERPIFSAMKLVERELGQH